MGTCLQCGGHYFNVYFDTGFYEVSFLWPGPPPPHIRLVCCSDWF